MNEDTITTLVDLLGAEGVQGLVDALDGLAAEVEDPDRRAVLDLLADALEDAGPNAITMIAGVIAGADAGERAVATTTDPRVTSDAVAALQLAEAARRSAAQDFLARVGAVLGQLLIALLRGLAAR